MYSIKIFLHVLSGIRGCAKNFSDPFAVEAGKDNTKVHIRVQQRNGRKCITTVQGLADDLDILKITRALKKTFKCNGSVVQDEELGEVIQVRLRFITINFIFMF